MAETDQRRDGRDIRRNKSSSITLASTCHLRPIPQSRCLFFEPAFQPLHQKGTFFRVGTLGLVHPQLTLKQTYVSPLITGKHGYLGVSAEPLRAELSTEIKE